MVLLVVTEKLTTPTEVKAATMLMRVGIMLNFPACNRRTAFGASFNPHSIVKDTSRGALLSQHCSHIKDKNNLNILYVP